MTADETTRYVDWVEVVLRELVEFKERRAAFLDGIDQLSQRLGLPSTDEAREALLNALADLRDLGLVEIRSQHDLRVTHEAKKIRVSSLRSGWSTIIEATWLPDAQMRFLAEVAGRSERREAGYAWRARVSGTECAAAAGIDDRNELWETIKTLDDLGLLGQRGTFGSDEIWITYKGLVVANERPATELQQLIQGLLPDWETANVDFKLRLRLDTKDEKAEFVRDVIALANTQVTGPRYLVIGFDDKTHAFAESVSDDIKKDRIENILNDYVKPAVQVHYRTGEWVNGSGQVGVLEVLRERRDVPYRVRMPLAGDKRKLATGDVFVRHGSHVAVPDGEELQELLNEAQRARQDE